MIRKAKIMKYYEVNFNGSQLTHFLWVHQNAFIGLVAVLGIIFFIAVIVSAAAEARGATILFLVLFGVNIIGPMIIGISISDPTNDNYYTSSDEVTPWTDNSVYLYSGNVEESEVPKTAPKLITRTNDKIKANSATGSAYLRVTQYLVDHQSEVNDVRVNVSMDKTEASFDNVDGHQKIVSYANGNKKQATASTVKVLKWQK